MLAFAKLSELQPGDILRADADFTCIEANARRVALKDDDGYYVICECGRHYLSGQLDYNDNDTIVGFYKT